MESAQGLKLYFPSLSEVTTRVCLIMKGRKLVFVTPTFDVGTYNKHKKIISRVCLHRYLGGTAIL